MNDVLLLLVFVALVVLLVWREDQHKREMHTEQIRMLEAFHAERERYIQQLTGVRFSPPEPGPRRAYGTDEDEWAVDQRRRAEGRESGEPV